MFINPYKYREKRKSEWYCWISPLVESYVFVVGWAVPTFDI